MTATDNNWPLVATIEQSCKEILGRMELQGHPMMWNDTEIYIFYHRSEQLTFTVSRTVQSALRFPGTYMSEIQFQIVTFRFYSSDNIIFVVLNNFKILFTKFAKIVETSWTWKIATLIHLTKTDDSFYFVVAYKLPKIIYGVWFWALSRNERFAIKSDIACIDIFSCW